MFVIPMKFYHIRWLKLLSFHHLSQKFMLSRCSTSNTRFLESINLSKVFRDAIPFNLCSPWNNTQFYWIRYSSVHWLLATCSVRNLKKSRFNLINSKDVYVFLESLASCAVENFWQYGLLTFNLCYMNG